MRWLIVGSLALPLLVGCRGEQQGAPDQEETGARDQEETGARDQEETGAQQAAGNGQASPWLGGAERKDETPTLAGTGAPGETPEDQREVALEGNGYTDNAVLFGQQIEPHGPDQLGIVTGHVTSVGEQGTQLTIERPDGSTVDLTVESDALVTLNERPVTVDRLQNLREGDPIRASYQAEEEGNLADRIEIPVGRVGQEKRQRELQQEQEQATPGATPRERGLVPPPAEGESPREPR